MFCNSNTHLRTWHHPNFLSKMKPEIVCFLSPTVMLGQEFPLQVKLMNDDCHIRKSCWTYFEGGDILLLVMLFSARNFDQDLVITHISLFVHLNFSPQKGLLFSISGWILSGTSPRISILECLGYHYLTIIYMMLPFTTLQRESAFA